MTRETLLLIVLVNVTSDGRDFIRINIIPITVFQIAEDVTMCSGNKEQKEKTKESLEKDL